MRYYYHSGIHRFRRQTTALIKRVKRYTCRGIAVLAERFAVDYYYSYYCYRYGPIIELALEHVEDKGETSILVDCYDPTQCHVTRPCV